MRWHVSRQGKLRGPFTESEMFELIGKRKIERGDLVDADQAGNWWPIEHVPTFAASFGVYYPPPAPVQQTPKAASSGRSLLTGCLALFGASIVLSAVAVRVLSTPASNRARSNDSAPVTMPRAPALDTSERCRLTAHDGKIIPVFPTKEGLNEFIDGAVKNLSARDLDVIAAANGGFGVESGTRCQMLDYGLMRSQVRVLEGEYSGRSGWVPTEFSHP